jgi:hypothetical protein
MKEAKSREKHAPMALSTWLGLAALLAGSAGSLVLSSHGNMAGLSVAVPKADLPAYHQVEAGDLAFRRVAEDALPAGTIVHPSGLVGRYTLAPLKKNETVAAPAMGPPLAPKALSGMLITAIPSSPGPLLGAGVQVGDLIDLGLETCCGQPGCSGGAKAVENVYFLDWKPEGQVAVIAVPSSRRGDLILPACARIMVFQKR